MSDTNSMYADADPRSKLASGKTASPSGGATGTGFGGSSYALFGTSKPQIDDATGQTWFARGQNFIVAYTRAKPGAVFSRLGQVDEYVLLSEDPAAAVTITANGETLSVPGERISFIPPGDSSVLLPNGGEIVRLFTTRSADLAALCVNAATYAEHQPHIPVLENWPDPVGGFRIRSYSLDVPPEKGRFGRIWRCTTFMVNVFEPAGPRDNSKLSPHHHDDFEQCSLALGGTFVHHLRWPWTANLADWREDEHVECPAPSIVVIPPRSIHTSASTEAEDNRLVDIFSPPRRDFSDMAGWVLNADEYPMPAA